MPAPGLPVAEDAHQVFPVAKALDDASVQIGPHAADLVMAWTTYPNEAVGGHAWIVVGGTFLPEFALHAGSATLPLLRGDRVLRPTDGDAVVVIFAQHTLGCSSSPPLALCRQSHHASEGARDEQAVCFAALR